MGTQRRLSFAVVLGLAAFSFACKAGIAPPATVEPTFTSIQQNIFSKNCTTSSCHSALSRRGGLILEEGQAYKNLVGIPAENLPARNQGLIRVAPGKPDSSFILIKLTGPGSGQGNMMPFNNGGLDQQSIDALRAWIANGAKQD